MSVRSHRDFVYLPCSIVQENIISDRANDRFSLKVLTPIGDVVLDIEILESFFSFLNIRSSC
jgi:hypothetical protein